MARLFTYLVVDSPGQSQQVIIWDTLEVTVGRSPDRDLVIPDSEVSRQHSLFRIEGQSHTVADLHTSNGTYVNGTRISRHQLRPGDVVELGPARIQFRQEAESPKGKNVKFASQLKGFAPFGEGEDAGNRTMLGIGGSAGLAMEQGDYSDRAPSGEAQFDLGGSSGPAPVVDLDSVLDTGLEQMEIASFEDEELTASLDDKEEEPVPPPRRAAARAPAPPPTVPRPAPAAARPAAPPRAAAPAPRPAPPVEEAPAAAVRPQPAARAAVAAPVESTDTTARATLSLEIEGPRAVLKSVLAALLDKDIEIPPLKLRVRRPQ
jgi:predicted component of type VI protein secretion system